MTECYGGGYYDDYYPYDDTYYVDPGYVDSGYTESGYGDEGVAYCIRRFRTLRPSVRHLCRQRRPQVSVPVRGE
jgi:hypothetical protein